MDKNTNCDPCQKQGNITEGKSWCPNCDEKLCNGCASHHRSSKATQFHKLLDINLLTEFPFSISTNQFCDQHCNIQIDYFCTHHDVIVCRACLADGHRTCKDVVVLDIACAGSKTTVLKETDRETKHIIETLVAFENGIETNRSSLNKECSQIENEIALEKSKAIGRLNELEKSLKTKLHRLRDKNEVIMTDELGKNKDINSQAKKRLQQIQLVEKHGTDKQAFLLAYELRKILPETEKSITELSMTNKTIQLHFKGNRGMEPSISTLGEITETRKENGMHYYSQLKEQQAQLSVVKEKTPMENFQVNGRYKTICMHVRGMIATDDGGLLLCNYSDEQGGVFVYSENGQHIKMVKLEYPFDIAFISRTDQYVVTLPDVHCIQFMNKDLTLDKCVKLKCTRNIYAVATLHQYIYIGEYGKILVLDFNGIGLREISINGVGFISYISVGHDSKIYVTETYGKLCSIEDETGNVRQFTSPEIGNSMGTIVMDTSGNVYSPDTNSSCVCKLSNDFELSQIITDSEFYNIHAICFNKNCSKLFVANNRGESIIILYCT
jgi:hypothetical protein